MICKLLPGLYSMTTCHDAAWRPCEPLLDQRHVIEPAGPTFKTLAELSAYATAHGVTLTPGTKAAS